MDSTEIVREILFKVEKIEKNKKVISEVLSENANAAGSMNMPRPTQKEVVDVLNIAANLGNNKCNLDHFHSQHKTCAELIESTEEIRKRMECNVKDMAESFQLIQKMYNSANLICEKTEQFDPVTESENTWLDI